jgi:hypothetical protein
MMRVRVAALVAAVVVAGAVPAAGAGAVELRPDAVGVFDPATGTWYLRDHSGRTTTVTLGRSGDVPLTGDWDGDGVDGIGVYRPADGVVLLRNDLLEPVALSTRSPAGGIAVAADLDGNGRDEVIVARAGRVHLTTTLPGQADPLPVPLGGDIQGMTAGDFDGDGADEIAVLRDGRIEAFVASSGVSLEVGEVEPVAGDWDGDGVDTLGGYHQWSALFTLYHGVAGRPLPTFLAYGSTGMLPVAGDFGPLPGDGDPPGRQVGLPEMALDDSGAHVAVLQEALAARGLYRGPIDGVYGWETAYGAMALKKVMGAERTWEFRTADSFLLADYALPPLPERPDEPERLEVDIGRQVMFRFEAGEVVDVIPVSTGGSYAYWSPRNQAVVGAGTPRGDFTLFNFAAGWHCDPLTGWCIYNPWSFTPYYAMHGYLSVPEYPASHGCIRVTTWDSDYLMNQLFVGIPIHVWDTYDPETGQTTP